MLLLPDPFGPATIQNFGLSNFLRDTVGRTEFFLVRAPGLGDIPLEDNAQVASERWAVCVNRKNSRSLSARFVNAFRHDRTLGMRRAALSVELPDYDPRHPSLSQLIPNNIVISVRIAIHVAAGTLKLLNKLGPEPAHHRDEIRKAGGDEGRVVDLDRLVGGKAHHQRRHRDAMIHMGGDQGAAPHMALVLP